MARQLKVWGGWTFKKKTANPNGSFQTRTLVAAFTKKRAAELIDYSAHNFSAYFVETGNDTELSIATEEGVWVNQGSDQNVIYERER